MAPDAHGCVTYSDICIQHPWLDKSRPIVTKLGHAIQTAHVCENFDKNVTRCDHCRRDQGQLSTHAGCICICFVVMQKEISKIHQFPSFESFCYNKSLTK